MTVSYNHKQRDGRRHGRRHFLIGTAAGSAIALLAASTAPAADVHWISPSGNWNDPANWVWDNAGVPTNNVPTATDRALLDFGTAGATAIVNSDVAEDPLSISIKNENKLSVETNGIVGAGISGVDALDSIRIGDGSGGSVVIADNGQLRNERMATNSDTDDIYVGVAAGGLGTLTQSGATSLVLGRDVRVGADGGTGTYTMTGGTADVNWLIVGRTGGTGTFVLDGGSVLAKFGTNSRFVVGDSNSSVGTVQFKSGLIETTGEVNLGLQGNTLNGSATVDHTGGTLIAGDDLFIGRGSASDTARGYGTYTLGADASSTATINIVATRDPVDPTIITNGGNFYMGYNGGIGTMTMNGGAVNVDANAYLGQDTRASALLRPEATLIQHGGTFAVAGILSVANLRGSKGTYNLDGSAVLNVGGAMHIGDTSATNLTTTGAVTVGDNAVVNVTGNLRLGIDGGLGSLTQTGGDINVGDRLRLGQLGGGGQRGRGTLDISGGTLDVADNFWMGDSSNGDGWFNLSGTGVVTITNSLIVGRISNGTAIFNQSGGTLTSGSLSIRSNTTSSAGEYNLSGGVLNTGVLTNNKTFNYTGGTANITSLAGVGTTTVGAGVELVADSVRQAAATIDGRITVRASGTAAGVSRIGDYTLGAAGTFDLNDNKLITDKAIGSFTAGAYTGVQGDVARAYNFGAWDLPGLTTSQQNAGPNAGPLSGTTTIGVATGEQILFIAPTDTGVFAGQTITGATTIAMYTYAGDLNFDGLVDGADYGTIDNYVQFPGSDGYANGDFNYDGVIDGADYGIIDNTIQLQGPPISASGAAASAGIPGVTAVPEPASPSVLGVAAASLLGRRWRRSRSAGRCGSR